VDGCGDDEPLVGVWLGDELSLDVGLELALELELTDELGLGLVLAPADLLAVELALALVLLVTDFVLDGVPDAGPITASTLASFGTEEQAVLTIGGLAASAASASPIAAEERNARPQTTPATVGLTMVCALTCGTSLQNSIRPDHPDAP
jgi:hypothetical protein